MAQKLFALTLLIATLTTGGCASVPVADKEANREAKSFAVKPGLANIYVYRTDLLGAAIAVPVKLDGVVAGKTARKTFLFKRVHPGRHTIVSRIAADVKLDVVTVAGQNYFVRQEIKLGAWRAKSELHLVDDAVGKQGVKKCTLID